MAEIEQLKSEGLKREYKIILNEEHISQEIRKELENLATTVKIPGFRKGKIPLKIIEQKYNASVYKQITTIELDKTIKKIIKDNNFQLAYEPIIDVIEIPENPNFEAIVSFEIMPDVIIPDLSSIELTKIVLNLTDDEVEKELNRIISSSKIFNKATDQESVEIGDKVEVDMEIKLDKEHVARKELQIVIGENNFSEVIEQKIIGAKNRQELVFDSKLSGIIKGDADRIYTLKLLVKQIYKFKQASIEQICKQTDCKDIEELKSIATNFLKQEINNHIASIYKIKLFDSLESLLEFDIPKVLIKREYNNLFEKMKYLQEDAKNEEEKQELVERIKLFCNKLALRMVKMGIFISEYAKIKNITVYQNEVFREIYADIRDSNLAEKEHEKVIKSILSNPLMLDSFSMRALENKTIEYILNNDIKTIEKLYSINEVKELIREIEQREEFSIDK